ncbi:toll-like receptor 1 [Gastrophryne carolinensis]
MPILTITCILTLTCMSMQVHCIERRATENQDLVANYSGQSLHIVPRNLSVLTTVLDLSYNIIEELEEADFSNLIHLKVLNISYNSITKLDAKIFESNQHLDYLDLSNNKLEYVSNIFPEQLQFLDISSNNFSTLSVCRNLWNLKHLDYLGLGAKQIRKSDLEAITHLQLQNVLIDLSSLTDYQNGSLLMLDTAHLHLSSLSVQKDIVSVLFDAVNASRSLELSNFGPWQEAIRTYIPVIAKNSRIIHLTMSNLSLSWSTLIYGLQFIWHSSVETFHLSEFTLLPIIFYIPFDYSNSSMKEIYLHNIQSKVFLFNQTNLYGLFSEMNIKNLTIRSANFLFMLCPSKPSNFQHIDLSNNAITDDVFQECKNLNKLETLKLTNNKLQSLAKVSSMTSSMKSLRHLDVSQNQLDYNEDKCRWSQSIKELNFASCSLTNSVFKCLSRNITWLNLAKNDIQYVPLNVSYFEKLEYLNIAYNRLSDLPDCTLFPRLMVLSIENNQIPYPSDEFTDKCQHVTHINMGHNPFHCSCDLIRFVGIARESPGKLIGWPEDYTCQRPDNLEGHMLSDFHMSEIYCNVFLLVPVIVVPVVLGLALVFGVCKYCDVPWYLKMTWQWTQTKHKTRRSKKGYSELHKDFDFHAFVSYSEQDASWVKHVLLPCIKNIDDSIQICQHERNFVAGKSIVQNIINCIERSYKSIFILSPHFVQSEWCHYELYFAHQQLFTDKTDNLILILLEPIPQYIIPSRYSRLKALMAKRTYLEWPKEKSKQGIFWANVRAAININLSDLHNENSQCESQPIISDHEISQSENQYISSDSA